MSDEIDNLNEQQARAELARSTATLLEHGACGQPYVAGFLIEHLEECTNRPRPKRPSRKR